jgi:hypothetical protein
MRVLKKVALSVLMLLVGAAPALFIKLPTPQAGASEHAPGPAAADAPAPVLPGPDSPAPEPPHKATHHEDGGRGLHIGGIGISLG